MKQEFVHGAFRDIRQALVPMVAAVTGAVVPAVVFVAFTFGHGDAARGWGIPMATDAAFAVAVLALIGRGFHPILFRSGRVGCVPGNRAADQAYRWWRVMPWSCAWGVHRMFVCVMV
ncbi:Na+/H+ antiporter NhaA [Nocardia fusca]|uniref:Na+/H+ antiporter NhaA n=1 Tax=Nocardia fusca TaxID=941183 RepID=UPI00350E5498